MFHFTKIVVYKFIIFFFTLHIFYENHYLLNASSHNLINNNKFIIIESIVAQVGKEIVLRSELDDLLKNTIFKNKTKHLSIKNRVKKALNFLIKEALIINECNRLNIIIENVELKNTIINIRKKFKLTPKEFKRALIIQGYTLNSYNKNIKTGILKLKLIKRKIEKKIHIKNSDILIEYNLFCKKLKKNSSVDLHHIIFKIEKNNSKQEKNKIKKLALNTASVATTKEKFFNLVEKFNKHNNIIIQNVGKISRKELKPNFEKIIFNAKEGQIVGPIKSIMGWHVILIKTYIHKNIPKFNIAKKKIKIKLFEQKAIEIFNQYIENLYSTTFIKINHKIIK